MYEWVYILWNTNTNTYNTYKYTNIRMQVDASSILVGDLVHRARRVHWRLAISRGWIHNIAYNKRAQRLGHRHPAVGACAQNADDSAYLFLHIHNLPRGYAGHCRRWLGHLAPLQGECRSVFDLLPILPVHDTPFGPWGLALEFPSRHRRHFTDYLKIGSPISLASPDMIWDC